MMPVTVIWHGTSAEGMALTTAITHNCTCKFGLMGVRVETCPPHKALLEDQRFGDGCLFVRHMLADRSPNAGMRVIPLKP